jgi:ribose transport system substrate-binding protein
VETGSGIVQAVKARARSQDYSIFTFDESPDILKWIDQGVISATLLQNPEEIGARSISFMLEWLEGKHNPLDRNYYTPIQLIKKKGVT